MSLFASVSDNIVIISIEEPIELVKTAKGLGYLVNIEKGREYRVSVFNPEKLIEINWRDRKENFEQLDVRKMKTDPFDIIIQKALSLILRFPQPTIIVETATLLTAKLKKLRRTIPM